MTKPALIAAISFLVLLPAWAQPEQTEPGPAGPGDARIVTLAPEGPTVTEQVAVLPPEAVRQLSDRGQTGQIDPVMRDSDHLVMEPLVSRVGIDSGSLVETVPAADGFVGTVPPAE